MKVKEFRNVANSEIKFQEKLRELNNEIKKSRDPKLYIDSIRTEFNKEATLIYELDSVNINDGYYISTVKNFCIPVVTHFLNDTERTYQYKLKNKEKLENELTNEYIIHVTEMFEDGFGNHEYEKDVIIDQELLNKLNIILSILNIEIIEKLVNIRPHIFLASSNGHCAIATTLCIILDQTEFFENDDLNLEKLFLTILNVIVECTLIRLFKQKLTVFDILRLQDIYKTTTEDILKVKLGKSIANYLVDNVEDLGMEYLISKNNIELN